MNRNFLGDFSEQALYALRPLYESVQDSQKLGALLFDLGWDFTSFTGNYAALSTSFQQLYAVAQQLTGNSTEEDVLQLLVKIQGVYAQIKSFPYPASLSSSDFSTTIAEDLINLLVVRYLSQYQPAAYRLLNALNIVRAELIVAAAPRKSFTRYSFNFGNLLQSFKNPLSLLQAVLGWKGSDLFSQKLQDLVAETSGALRIPAVSYRVSDKEASGYRSLFSIADNIDYAVRMTLAALSVSNSVSYMNVSVIGTSDSSPVNSGFLVQLDIPSAITQSFQVADDLSLNLSATSLAGTSPVFLIKPSGLDVKTLGQPGTSLSAVGLSASLKYTPATPKVMLGKPEGTRLQLNGVGISLGARNESGVEIFSELDLSGLSFVVDPSDADGFVSKVFGSDKREISLPVIVQWSSKSGLKFKGSGGFEVAINPNLSFGPINVTNVLLALKAVDGKPLKIEAGATVSGKLGPVGFVAENLGLGLALDKAEGNVGPFDIKLGFKAPDGIGLSIDAKPVSGGGYIQIDADRGRYSGALKLQVGDIGISGIGLITTQAPDGSAGFTMIAAASATFPAVQLGLGFSLIGAGVLGGINRGLNPDALRAGVKGGSIDDLMFPKDIVENAPRIIRDMEAYFPVSPNRYTFGAFFLLDWGVGKSLAKIKMGIIASFPRPVQLAIIGTVRVALPEESDPRVQINVAFAGIIDFDQKFLSFDASLFDSRLRSLSIAGDMAVRLFWGTRREMVMTAGGFHPAFSPASYLKLPAKIDRLSFTLYDQDNLTVKCSAYFAITSNTLQLGARADLLLRADSFRLVGYLGFDALFQFNPFRFITHVQAGAAIFHNDRELLSISIDVTLSGPGPWHAVGRAEFKILCFRQEANLERTWGEVDTTVLPAVSASDKILEELSKVANWQAVLPAAKPLYVTLGNLGDSLALHPVGRLRIMQKAAPFGVRIEHFGSQPVTEVASFDITQVTIGDAPAFTYTSGLAGTSENFAPSQFRNMDDQQRLKSPSFEHLRCGVEVQPADELKAADRFYSVDLDYSITLIDDVKIPATMAQMTKEKYGAGLASGGAMASSPARKKVAAALAKPVARPVIGQEQYKLVSKDSLAAYQSDFGSMAEAFTAHEDLLASNTWLKDRLALVPQY